MKSSTSTKKVFLAVIIFIIFYFYSGPLEYFGLPNRVATFLSYFILIVIIFLSDINIMFRFSLIRFLFFIYLLLKLISYFLLYNDILQPIVSFSHFFLLVILLQLSEKDKIIRDLPIGKIVYYSLLHLFFVSIIQYFQIEPLNNIFSNYGNNPQSGRLINDVFIKRVNGGIGGTVIDFSCLIILLNYINMFLDQKKLLSMFNFLILLILSLFSFSRITLLSYFFILLSYSVLFTKKNNTTKKFVLILILLLLIMSFFAYLLNNKLQLTSINLLNLEEEISRINMWLNSLKADSILIGSDLGKNTGLPVNSGKVVTDGLFFGIFYDMGLIGLILYIFMIFEPLIKTKNKMKNKDGIVIYLLIFNLIIINIINSSFNYHLNTLFYFILIVVLKKYTLIE